MIRPAVDCFHFIAARVQRMIALSSPEKAKADRFEHAHDFANARRH